MEKEISEEELNQRLAVLRRFRQLLEEQRKKFQEYLLVLEKQQNSIEAEDSEAIICHAELEQQVVKGISNLQKVIVPMNEMYNASVRGRDATAEKTVEDLQYELNKLQNKVLEQNQINRNLLREHMNVLRTQIENFKNPYRNNRSIYATKVAEGNLIAVEV
ncbi:MAG: flagellar biosynthesis protein FlgN [Treponema sp.]|nr:flagellar biosynthesis protein FlgN [Treponema sp.]